MKGATFCFTPLGESEKQIRLGLTSEVPLVLCHSDCPRFPHGKGGSRGHGAGAAVWYLLSPLEFGTTGAGGQCSWLWVWLEGGEHSCQPGKKRQLQSRKSKQEQGWSTAASWAARGVSSLQGSPFPPPGSSTYRVNVLPCPAQVWDRCLCSAGPIMGPEVRITAGFGGVSPLLPL